MVLNAIRFFFSSLISGVAIRMKTPEAEFPDVTLHIIQKAAKGYI